MHVLAAFLDSNGNNEFDVADAAILVGFIVAVASAISAVLVFATRRLREEILDVVTKRTQPIQSGYENDGNSLTDISNRQQTIAVRQSDMSHEIADLRSSNDAKHEALAAMIDKVTAALSRHAASPAHDQRTHDTRSTDTQE